MTHLNTDSFGSEPFATTLVHDGDFDQEAFKLAYGSGLTQVEEDFGFRFAYSLATQTAAKLSTAPNLSFNPTQNLELTPAVQRFAQGALHLNDELFTFAFDYLKSTLAESIPDWSYNVNSTPSLSTETKKSFARIIAETRDFTPNQRNVLIDALSDAHFFYGKSTPATHKNEARLARAKAMFIQSELDAITPNASHPSRPTHRM